MTVEKMTPSEVLEALRKFFPDFGAMQDAIGERRYEIYRSGKALGSVATAFDLLGELRRRTPDA